MKISIPRTAYARRQTGDWDAFVLEMEQFDEAFALVWWWTSPPTLIVRGDLPPEWQEQAEEMYEKRLEKLRARY